MAKDIQPKNAGRTEQKKPRAPKHKSGDIPPNIHAGTFDSARDAMAENEAGMPDARDVNANLSGQGNLDAPREEHDDIPLDETYARTYGGGSIKTRDPLGEIPTGIHTAGVPSDTTLTVEDAMQGNVVGEGSGGSGGTGGDLTGERTPGGMSVDLTTGYAGGGTQGGPTGGTYTGHGEDAEGTVARPGSKTEPDLSETDIDHELERRVIVENTRKLQNRRK